MLKKFILVSLLGTNILAVDHQCAQIDPKNTDVDGMPFCPDVVAQNSAWAVYDCAIQQAKSFHPPTVAEKSAMHNLLLEHQKSTIAGPTTATTTALLSFADQLNLQACRVSKTLDGAKDSFLVVYVKPNINDYSGPFLMLRETKHSKVALIGPHDDSDGTYADTKVGLANSHALVLVSNGHKRGNVGTPNGDFVHETNNLGTFTVGFIGDMYPGYVWLHIHGMAEPKKALYRSRTDQLSKAFETSIVAHTNIAADAFGNLNADFTVDSQVNTNFYLKTEIPARIHENNQGIIASLVRDIEKNPWAQLSASGNMSAMDESLPVKYVPMPPIPDKPHQILLTMVGAAPGLDGELKNIGATMCEFENRMSRGRVKMTSVVGKKGDGKINDNNKLLDLEPGQASHVPIIGNGISAKHELGHEFSLGHASTRIWDTQTVIKSQAHEHDAFDPMTISPGVPSYNAPHLHFLQWFSPTEEAYAEDGGEYVLQVLNDGGNNKIALKSLYYEVPGSTRKYWFSYVQDAGGWGPLAGMPGTGIAIHSADPAGSSTFLEGLIGLEAKTNIRSGLILTLSEATRTSVRVKVSVDPTWVLQN